MLLITFVVKSTSTPSAQATPRHLDAGVVGSPIGSAGSPYQTPIPMGQTGSHISPIPSHLPPYGSPAQHQPPHLPPYPSHQQSLPYQPQQDGPKGIEAARQVLGDLAGAPVIGELLNQAPWTGVTELSIIKEIFDTVPASRNDFKMLTDMLAMKSQQRTERAV